MPPKRGTRVRRDTPMQAPDASVLFGWCMDGFCERCIVQFKSSGTGATYTCSCACHTPKEES